MGFYKYKCRDKNGNEITGKVEADNREEVESRLRRQGYEVSSIRMDLSKIELKIPGFSDRVSGKDLVIYTRTFSTMLDAGLPLVQCLEILVDQTPNVYFASKIREVRRDVEGGMTYADSLRKHPKVFDDLYCNMIEAGEVGGILDTILNRLADYMEKAIALKREVKSAMTYPAVIISVALLVVAALMTWVIPTFADVFVQLGGALPLPTRIVMGVSNFFKNYLFYIIVFLILAYIGYKQFAKTRKGRKLIDTVILKVPIFGPLLKKVAVAKFTRTLSTLISSGVQILDGLEITAKTAGNVVIEEAVMKTRLAISEGKTMSEPLAETKVFPPMVIQMISVGESTGALDQMLDKIAGFYDDEVEVTVHNLTQLLEPFLMVFLGVLIGFIVVAMYLPMFALIGQLQST